MPKIAIVDDNDNITGFVEKEEAHRKKLQHRAFSVLIVDENMNMLIQKRAVKKYHSGGLWSNSACSHLQENETMEQAAARCIKNELGIVTGKMIPIGKFTYKVDLDNGMSENEIDTVILAFYNENNFEVNADEIAELRWISVKELFGEVSSQPEKFTFWFKKILNEVMHIDALLK